LDSDQKTLKVGIQSFPALRLVLKGLREGRPLSSLVVSLSKALNRIVSTFEWLGW